MPFRLWPRQLSSIFKATQETLSKLLALLETSETDNFVTHLYQARKHYRQVCKRPNKGKATERAVLSSYQTAQSLGFNGDFRALGALAADSGVSLRNERGSARSELWTIHIG